MKQPTDPLDSRLAGSSKRRQPQISLLLAASGSINHSSLRSSLVNHPVRREERKFFPSRLPRGKASRDATHTQLTEDGELSSQT